LAEGEFDIIHSANVTFLVWLRSSSLGDALLVLEYFDIAFKRACPKPALEHPF